MTRWAWLLALLLAGGSLSGCAYRGWKGTIKIGFVGSFSGSDSNSAYTAYRAVQLAVAERNAVDGPGGYRVEVVALDDRNDAQEAARQAREMAADPGVLGVVGYTDGPAAAAAEEELATARLPALLLAARGSTGAASASEPGRQGVVHIADQGAFEIGQSLRQRLGPALRGQPNQSVPDVAYLAYAGAACLLRLVDEQADAGGTPSRSATWNALAALPASTGGADTESSMSRCLATADPGRGDGP